MATAPVTIKLSLEVTVNGDGTVRITQNGNDGTNPSTSATASEWDPTIGGGIRKFKMFGGTGSDVLGYVIVINENQNPPAGYTAGHDHWVWTGSQWVDCFRMETTTDNLPGLNGAALDMFPVNKFDAGTATVPAGAINANERLWQVSRREADNSFTELPIYLHKYNDGVGKLHLDFYAHPNEVNNANYLIWSGNHAYVWNRKMVGPSGASNYRKVEGLKKD